MQLLLFSVGKTMPLVESGLYLRKYGIILLIQKRRHQDILTINETQKHQNKEGKE